MAGVVPHLLLLARSSATQAREQGDAPAHSWHVRGESYTRLRNASKLAEALDTRTRADQLDVDPWLLAAGNCTIDLRTGEAHEPRREDLITRCVAVDYDPAAQCPRFLRYLVEVFREPALIGYMIRWLGYCLTGSVQEQVIQLWHGHGANGKSTLIQLVLGLLGAYACKLPSELLVVTRTTGGGNAATPALMRLRGRRLAVGVESSEGQRWHEPLLKELTGTDTIAARGLYKDPIEFEPSWKLVIAVNHRPIVRGADHGIWRRIHLVPFAATFTGVAREFGLLDRLRDEAPGVLALLVRGAVAWRQQGLDPPGIVLAAGTEYRRSQDTIGQFLAERTRSSERSRTPVISLYRTYRAWALEGGEYVHGRGAFARMIGERGIVIAEGTAIGVEAVSDFS